MVEVAIYQDNDFVHKVFLPDFKLPKLDEAQKQKVLGTLKSNCVGCTWNGDGCATMDAIDERMNLRDSKGELVMTEWCDAVGQPVGV